MLRELQRAKPELPVVILSARGDVQTKLRGFELGATDYVAKPFSLDELLARIRVQAARRGGFGDEHVLRGGRVVLDVARRQARVGERSADLSDREFRLLHHLLLHVGEVVSRERLLAEVWGYDFDPARTSSTSACAGCGRSSGRTRRSRRCGMRATGWLRRNRARPPGRLRGGELVAMVAWPSWETIPFHFVWISLTIVYGIRVWSTRTMWAVLSL